MILWLTYAPPDTLVMALSRCCAIASGAYALAALHQAGGHGSKGFVVPNNVTLLPLPANSLELNPVENIWQLMRDIWFSNQSYDRMLVTSEVRRQFELVLLQHQFRR
ncbi:MAG: hypothetical protein ACLP4V_33100 [Methylocella sp.]